MPWRWVPPVTMLDLKGKHLDGYDRKELVWVWYAICVGLDVSGSFS